MQISQNATLIDSRLWVTPQFCTHHGVSLKTVESGMSRFRSGLISKWENYKTQKLGVKSLTSFDSVDWNTITLTPPDKDSIINELTILTRQEEESQKQSIQDIWKPFYQPLDAKFYQDKYNVNSGRANGRDRAKELAICCAILRMLNTYSTKAKIHRHTGFQSKKELQEAIFQYISNFNEGGLYGLPSSYRNFQPKFKKFIEALSTEVDERETLLNGHYGNEIGVKFDESHRTVLIEVYCKNPWKNDKLFCYQDYKSIMISELGYSEEALVSYSRFKQKTQERDIELLAAKCRMGKSYYETFVRPFVIRKAPQYSMSLVAGDGWMPGRTVRQEIRKVQHDGTIKKEIRNRAMNVWFWFDWKSSAIVSHHITASENSEAIRKSFRNIIGFMGVCPRSVMLDKGWANQSDIEEMFETSDVYVQPKRSYNPQGSIAERNNKEANKHHRNIDPFWVDITNNTVQFKHNEDWVRQAKPLEEADFRAMVYEIIERHNHTPRKSLNGQTPWQVLQENINPDCKAFDPLELTYIFGSTRNPRVRNYQFSIDIATKNYRYIIPAAEELTFNRMNPRKDKVVVYFDEMHMDTVDVYTYDVLEDKATHRFICTAVDANEDAINAARIEEPLGEKFANQRERGEVLDKWIEDELEQHEEDMSEMGLDHAAVQNASQERFKEAHSNAIALQYRNFHQEREEAEGHRVTNSEKLNKPWTEKEKLAALEEEVGDKWKD